MVAAGSALVVRIVLLRVLGDAMAGVAQTLPQAIALGVEQAGSASHTETPSTPEPEARSTEAPSGANEAPTMQDVGNAEWRGPSMPSARSPTLHVRREPSGTFVVRQSDFDHVAEHGLPGASAHLERDEAGQPIGLRLSGMSMLMPYGVRDGDVLTSVNGMPVRTPDEGVAALGALKDAHEATVTLLRDGQPMTLTARFE